MRWSNPARKDNFSYYCSSEHVTENVHCEICLLLFVKLGFYHCFPFLPSAFLLPLYLPYSIIKFTVGGPSSSLFKNPLWVTHPQRKADCQRHRGDFKSPSLFATRLGNPVPPFLFLLLLLASGKCLLLFLFLFPAPPLPCFRPSIENPSPPSPPFS